MAENIIDSLLISLNIDPKEFDRGLQQAEQALNAFERKALEAGKSVEQIAQEFTNWGLLAGNVSNDVAAEILKTGTASQKASLVMGRAFDNVNKKALLLKRAISSFIAPLVGAFAGAKIWNAFSEGGERLADLSDRIGVNVQKIDMWAKANRDAGGSAEAFQTALENWTNGMGRSAQSFFNLGKHIEGMSNRQAAFYLKNIGLSNEAAAVFIKYKGAANEAAEAYRGLAMTEEQVRRAKEFNVLWRRFTDQAKMLGNVFIMFLLPPIELVVKALDKLLKFGMEHTRFLKMAFIGLSAVLGGMFLMNAIKTLTTIGSMIKAVTGLTTVARGLWAVFAANPIGAVIVGVMALIAIIEDVYAYFTGAPSVTGVFVDAIASAFDKASEIVLGWFESVGQWFSGFGTKIKEAIAGWFNGAKDFLGSIFSTSGDNQNNTAGAIASPAAQGVASAMAVNSPSSTTNNNSNVQVQAYITTPADPDKVGAAVGKQTQSAISNANNMIVNNQSGVVQKG